LRPAQTNYSPGGEERAQHASENRMLTQREVCLQPGQNPFAELAFQKAVPGLAEDQTPVLQH